MISLAANHKQTLTKRPVNLRLALLRCQFSRISLAARQCRNHEDAIYPTTKLSKINAAFGNAVKDAPYRTPTRSKDLAGAPLSAR
jgi:hypothetical protein